ncbi:o-succinylbenzoate synthase [Hyunsoonleella pacifica]|uniref:O-succinylbenzoate synthase n=1 Tax=Hyunsoonleella pacifica TaxID=1080224 RepID=A0A4Q9FQT3_9FLAO|nr:o-succinylbenzoate synthase [Hyunsoonleella pacifica]TBN17821.1 o-succinylbenzoate synthase [Hyunsoonleella pacifica]GGD08690.1 o-succinylbenzoate synthase [Hyunsoonleella pacifica]
MKASFQHYILNFKNPSGTSRGVLKTKDTWIITIYSQGKTGIGECGMFRGLSIDDRPDFIATLEWTCKNIDKGLEFLLLELKAFPSVQFGLEMAFKALEAQHSFELFASNFTKGNASIPINGLIWMGDKAFMQKQIAEKIDAGFSCIKMKIGAIDFDTEVDLLKSIRKTFTSKDIELRIDANGAFNPNDASEKLKILSDLDLHSIEQPIKQGQIEEMTSLCETTPLPIALDEELIGVFDVTKKAELLQTIRPQYIILKPTLVGGYEGSDIWIDIAEQNNIGWWITSALESNIGLNAIAQYTFKKQNHLPQGLGTGSLFTNNFESPLFVNHGELHYNKNKSWNINL